jgi:hypothetical protein
MKLLDFLEIDARRRFLPQPADIGAGAHILTNMLPQQGAQPARCRCVRSDGPDHVKRPRHSLRVARFAREAQEVV